MSPSWSSDNKKLAYVSFEKGYPEIYMQDLFSGKRESIKTLGLSNSAPVWSPDNKKLAFVMSMSGNPDIYIYDLINKKDTSKYNYIIFSDLQFNLEDLALFKKNYNASII